MTDYKETEPKESDTHVCCWSAALMGQQHRCTMCCKCDKYFRPAERMIDWNKPGEFGDGYRFAVQEIAEKVEGMYRESPEDEYVCPNHRKTFGYEPCCSCGGWGLFEKRRHCTTESDPSEYYNQALDDLLTHLRTDNHTEA